MIAFNSTYFYLIVCYAHMKIFLLYMRNISFIFIIIIILPKRRLRLLKQQRRFYNFQINVK